MIYLYLLIFLGVFAGIAWRNFPVALYLVLIFLPTYWLRLQIFWIPTTVLELTIYVAFLVWLVRVFSRRATVNWPAIRSYLGPAILIFLGLAIGTWASSDKLISLGIIKGWFIDPWLLFVMLTSALSTKLHVKKSIAALMISGILLSGLAIYQVIFNDFVTIDNRASAIFSSANYLSLYLVPVIILGTGLLFSMIRSRRIWALGGLGIMLVALYFTFSYAGWLGLITGLVTLMLMFLPVWPTLLGTAAMLGVGIISQWSHPKFQQMLDLVGRSSSHVRLEVWQTTWLMIKENYLFGIGLGLFEKRYPEFVNRLFSPPLEPIMLHAHNVFLHFWVNAGIVGLIGFVAVIVNFFRHIIRALVTHKHILIGAVLAAMVALLVHGLADTAYWKNDLSALFWTIIALGIILSRNLDNGRTGLSHRH